MVVLPRGDPRQDAPTTASRLEKHYHGPDTVLSVLCVLFHLKIPAIRWVGAVDILTFQTGKLGLGHLSSFPKHPRLFSPGLCDSVFSGLS